MNSILLNYQDETITDPEVLIHLHQVLKLSIGDKIKVTILNLGIGIGLITELTDRICRISSIELQETNTSWFDLIVGASRPQTMKKVLEHATTFGANSFHFYRAQLSEKSYLTSKIFEPETMNSITRLGLAQSATYSTIPQLSIYQQNPANHFQNYSQKYILDLNAKDSFKDIEIDFKLPIALSIGPERGFTVNDIAHFTNAGFKSIKISKTVLRVEHAIYSAISQLELMKRNF